ncbi:hypothetical protein ASG88_06400 [Nocardioides sp. Soil777]|uniref:DinB family protein n=1 Tax=Nocardioides sp. Soil777 TaxID=1736409 RepID=UPI0007025BCF|nr:DinB family protein [Nocardioides sp. Soil777]KRF02979.1 hypothetical protein ASG88_06400 [Nocardioides sp. Soil777]
MSDAQKKQLHDYLVESREALCWKTEGLSEYDVRRPLTPTGTNLLGLVKHLSIVEASYFGATFGRPFPRHLPWWDDDAPEEADMWATADEGRDEILGTYREATAHADGTIRSLALDAPGHVSWWSRPDVTLHGVLVHVVAETSRHVGHADIVRELVDGQVGMRAGNSNLAPHDGQGWVDHRARIEAAARAASR